jgi:hypothetical protein
LLLLFGNKLLELRLVCVIKSTDSTLLGHDILDVNIISLQINEVSMLFFLLLHVSDMHFLSLEVNQISVWLLDVVDMNAISLEIDQVSVRGWVPKVLGGVNCDKSQNSERYLLHVYKI